MLSFLLRKETVQYQQGIIKTINQNHPKLCNVQHFMYNSHRKRRLAARNIGIAHLLTRECNSGVLAVRAEFGLGC